MLDHNPEIPIIAFSGTFFFYMPYHNQDLSKSALLALQLKLCILPLLFFIFKLLTSVQNAQQEGEMTNLIFGQMIICYNKARLIM